MKKFEIHNVKNEKSFLIKGVGCVDVFKVLNAKKLNTFSINALENAGLNNYELWLTNGNEGTLEDYFNSCSTSAPGGSDFWEATLNDTTATYIYKGGLNGTDWQINRYDRANNMARTSAKQSNNSGKTTLTAAWSGRLTLNYS